MKKLLFALLILAGVANAATPTFTITPSSTPTPTATPTPVAMKDKNMVREYFTFNALKQDDGVTGLLTYSANVANSVYVLQQGSYTAAAFSTMSAAARFQFTVPNDYQNSLRFYAYGNMSVVGVTTTSLIVNVSHVGFNKLTSTTQVYPGASTNIMTQNFCPLQDGGMSRFALPLSQTVATQGFFKQGDLVNVEISRSAGTTGVLNIFEIEAEYQLYPGRNR